MKKNEVKVIRHIEPDSRSVDVKKKTNAKTSKNVRINEGKTKTTNKREIMCSNCEDLRNFHDGAADECYRERCDSSSIIIPPSLDEKPEITTKSKSFTDKKRTKWWERLISRWKTKQENSDGTLRSLGRRSSVENFGLIGLLTPALVLLPQVNGADALTGQFADLKGEHRELKLAAAHIEDALSGRGKYGKARSFFKSQFAQRCFKILHHVWYNRIFLATIIIHAVLIFWEPPSVDKNQVHWSIYFVGFLCVALYLFDVFIHIRFLNWGIFWSLKTVESYWNGVEFVLVFMFTIDYLILIISRFTSSYVPQPFRSLRLAMLLCKVKSIRHIFVVLTTIGTRLLKVFFIILVFIVIFASIGVHLYMDVYNTVQESPSVNNVTSSNCCIQRGTDEEVYIGTFDNIGNAMLRLFVLLSTENYPEIMLPALRNHKVNFLFFAVFLFVGIFLLAILLAIVVDSYWLFAKKHVKKERARERAELAKAWNLLDPLGLGALSVYDEQFRNLFRILKPKNTDEQNQLLIELLDSNMDGEIDSFEWTTLLRQALQAEFEEDPAEDESEESADKTTTRLREMAKNIVESTLFSKAMLCLIFLHCALFAMRWKGQTAKDEIYVQSIRTCIVLIFMFEALLRIVALGRSILHTLEITDAVLVYIALFSDLLWYIDFPAWQYREYSVTVSSVAVFLRLFLNSAETRKGFYWFLSIAPVMVDLMILLLVIMYLLSVIGMELFHTFPVSENQIYPDNCGLSFKTFYCSFLVQFQMLTTSNWHEIMNMVEKETKSKASYLYFSIAYIIITMIVMNLFIAIAIEAANKLAMSKEDREDRRGHLKTRDSTFDKKLAKRPQEVAKKVLNNLAKKLFASARVEDIHQRDRQTPIVLSNATITGTITGSNTIILQSPHKKSPSGSRKTSSVLDPNRVFHIQQSEELFVSESSESEEEDYSGLAPNERRERQLKRRMRRKRRERRHRELREEIEAARINPAWFDVKDEVRVVTAFKGMKDGHLPLTVGDTVLVLEKNDDWLKGELRGKIGWFPASHVMSWAAKSRVEKSEPETAVVSSEVFVAEHMDTLERFTPEEILSARENNTHFTVNNVHFNEKHLSPGSNSSLQPISPPRHRLKMKSSGDWTRNILGDITVMNADEMRELNKVMRAEMRAPLLVGRGRQRPQLGYGGSGSNLSQREHGILTEELEDGGGPDGIRLRHDLGQDTRRGRSGTLDSLSKVRIASTENRRGSNEVTDMLRNRLDSGQDMKRSRNSALESQAKPREVGMENGKAMTTKPKSQLDTGDITKRSRSNTVDSLSKPRSGTAESKPKSNEGSTGSKKRLEPGQDGKRSRSSTLDSLSKPRSGTSESRPKVNEGPPGSKSRLSTGQDTKRPRSNTGDSLSKARVGTPDSKPKTSRPSNGAPKTPTLPLRPLSASKPSRPVTPTRVPKSRQRTRTASSTSSGDVSSSPVAPDPHIEPSTAAATLESEASLDQDFVVSVDRGTPSPPETMDSDSTNRGSQKQAHLNVSRSPRSDKKSSKKKEAQKQKSSNGEMPSWMKSFVESNNLVVADDVKLK